MGVINKEELFDQAQALPLPLVRELLEPIVLLGEFVPTEDRNLEGTPLNMPNVSRWRVYVVLNGPNTKKMLTAVRPRGTPVVTSSVS